MRLLRRGDKEEYVVVHKLENIQYRGPSDDDNEKKAIEKSN